MTDGEPRFRVVSPDDDVFPALGRIWADAFPGAGYDAAGWLDVVPKWLDAIPSRIVAAELDGVAVGGAILLDLVMNVRGRDARTAGIGLVGVSLAHKRRGIARGLVRWSLAEARRLGATFAALYPFRPDFYRALGFGYGTTAYRFRFAPGTLRDDGARGTPRLLDERDADAFAACHERIRIRVNGLMAVGPAWAARSLARPGQRYVGVADAGGVLRAYMATAVIPGPPDTANRSALLARDMLAEDPASFAALLAYLGAQRDQFCAIVVETQDAAFFLAARDPRDGSDALVAPPGVHRVAEAGLGIMYRAIDPARAFAHLGPVETPFALRVDIDDPFAGDDAAATFRFGRYAGPQRDDQAHPDATLRIGIGDVSSLLTGSLDLRALVAHRVASLEPDVLLDRVDRAFRPDQRPVCTTRF